MQKLKGRLQFTGWSNLPWKLTADNGEIDLCPGIERYFDLFNGKRAKHKQTKDSYTLSLDETSEYRFCYKPDEFVSLQKIEGSGFFDVHAFLEGTLGWLSGRLIEVEISETELKITADESEEVYGLYFTHGNSCKLPKGIEKAICKIGKADCCIFLSIGSEGIACQKFSGPMAQLLLDRLAKGAMRESRIGNCALLGREEGVEAPIEQIKQN